MEPVDWVRNRMLQSNQVNETSATSTKHANLRGASYPPHWHWHWEGITGKCSKPWPDQREVKDDIDSDAKQDPFGFLVAFLSPFESYFESNANRDQRCQSLSWQNLNLDSNRDSYNFYSWNSNFLVQWGANAAQMAEELCSDNFGECHGFQSTSFRFQSEG